MGKEWANNWSVHHKSITGQSRARFSYIFNRSLDAPRSLSSQPAASPAAQRQQQASSRDLLSLRQPTSRRRRTPWPLNHRSDNSHRGLILASALGECWRQCSKIRIITGPSHINGRRSSGNGNGLQGFWPGIHWPPSDATRLHSSSPGRVLALIDALLTQLPRKQCSGKTEDALTRLRRPLLRVQTLEWSRISLTWISLNQGCNIGVLRIIPRLSGFRNTG